MKYESAILITNTKGEAANLIGLVLTLSIPILLVSFILLQTFSQQLSLWFREDALVYWIFVCPISAFFIIVYNCYNEWCVRHKYFINLSWNKITNASSTTLSKLLFGVVKITENGLIVGDLIGRSISASACIIHAYKKDKNAFLQISRANIKHLARRYKEFPKFAMPDQLLNKVGVAFPVLFIGAHFNSTEVGYYAMTMNVLSIPISVISIAVRDVFRQKANEEYKIKGNCHYAYSQLLKFLVITGTLGTVLIIYFLPFIFKLVLGQQWVTAGEYSQILLPMITLNFISMSLSGVLIITEKLKLSMYWQIYYVAITVCSLFVGFFFFESIKLVLVCFAIGRASSYLLYILLSYKYSKGPSRSILRNE